MVLLNGIYAKFYFVYFVIKVAITVLTATATMAMQLLAIGSLLVYGDEIFWAEWDIKLTKQPCGQFNCNPIEKPPR